MGLKTTIGITGLSENMDRDDAIEESYWGTFRERERVYTSTALTGIH